MLAAHTRIAHQTRLPGRLAKPSTRSRRKSSAEERASTGGPPNWSKAPSGCASARLFGLNTLLSEAERAEHLAVSALLKNLVATFKAPAWPLPEADALDLLTMASMLHRRLDQAVLTKPGG